MSELVTREKEVTLLDLLDRILNKGVILWGDIAISVADVDLIYVGLKVLLSSIETAEQMRSAAAAQYPQYSTLDLRRDPDVPVRDSRSA